MSHNKAVVVVSLTGRRRAVINRHVCIVDRFGRIFGRPLSVENLILRPVVELALIGTGVGRDGRRKPFVNNFLSHTRCTSPNITAAGSTGMSSTLLAVAQNCSHENSVVQNSVISLA